MANGIDVLPFLAVAFSGFAAVGAMLSWFTVVKFYRGQAIHMQAQMLNDWNREIISAYSKFPDAALSVGRPVLADSDLVADCLNFMYLHQVRVVYFFYKNDIFDRDSAKAVLRNAAVLFSRYEREYVDAILCEGVFARFCQGF